MRRPLSVGGDGTFQDATAENYVIPRGWAPRGDCHYSAACFDAPRKRRVQPGRRRRGARRAVFPFFQACDALRRRRARARGQPDPRVTAKAQALRTSVGSVDARWCPSAVRCGAVLFVYKYYSVASPALLKQAPWCECERAGGGSNGAAARPLHPRLPRRRHVAEPL